MRACVLSCVKAGAQQCLHGNAVMRVDQTQGLTVQARQQSYIRQSYMCRVL